MALIPLMNGLWRLGLYSTGLVVLAAAAFVIYQLYFHPLARFPGPPLGKITNLYAGYHAWRGDIHLDMEKCHEKYGDYVRYAPNRILFNTAEALQDIYKHGSNVQKSVVYDELVHRAWNTLTIRDKKDHGRRRRIISQGFSDAALRGFEPAVLDRVFRLCSQLVPEDLGKQEEWSAPQNMARWFDYLTFDIMADVVFSSGYDTIGKPDVRPVIPAIEKSNVRISVLFQAPEVRRWKLDKKLFPNSIPARNIFIKFVSRVLKERMLPDKKGSKDIFNFLQSAKDPETGSGLTMQELGAEATTLIVAGSDTTSTTLSAVMFYLTHNPAAYAKALHEVRSTFTSADQVHIGSTLSSCTYLRACIDEALRISPPVGACLWREVGPGGATFDSHFIPAGCDVGIPIHTLHRNPRYYSEPTTFKPERWLEGKAVGSQMPMSPFSIGPRSCVGKSLAMVELMLTISILILKFDFKVNEELKSESGLFELKDHVTSAKKGPYVSFKARN